jgi:hypothetical protein
VNLPAITITNPAAPPVITQFLANGTEVVPYYSCVTASDATNISITFNNGIPPGLTLTGSCLSGTPIQSGSYNYTVTASGPSGTVSQSQTLTIFSGTPQNQAPTWVSYFPPNGTVNSGYGYSFVANGIPSPTYSASGNVPPGLTLGSNGYFSGTPTQAGTYTFTVTASNSAGSASQTVTVTIDPLAQQNTAPVWSLYFPPAGTINVNYGYTFVATGVPSPSYSLVSGSLPPGLTLAADGTLTGIPTAAGTFGPFTVRASNIAGSVDTPPVYITINNVVSGNQAPVWVNQTPPLTTSVGAAYSYTFLASGIPTPTYSLVSGSLPPGLTFNPTTGELSGSPTAAGTYGSIVIGASNSQGSITSTPFTIVVASNSQAPVWVNQTPPLNTNVGAAYSYTFLANGIPTPTYSLVSGTLPPGLTFNPTTGVLSGSPTTAGTYGPIVIGASNSQGSITSTPFTIVVTSIACNTVSTLAGGLGRPLDVATDLAGNVYVADANTVKKITPAGVVTTLSSSFQDIYGIAADAGGTVYVTDYYQRSLHRVSPTGAVTLIAGGPTKSGYQDGPVATAKFQYLSDVAIDTDANLYVGDWDYIRKISPTGIVTSVNSVPLSTTFGMSTIVVNNLVVHPNGTIYFTCLNGTPIGNRIWQMTQSGVVSAVAGSSTPGYLDGPLATAQFGQIMGITLDTQGNLYAAEYNNGLIRHINLTTGLVSTIAGSSTYNGTLTDGVGTNSGFRFPWGVALDATGNLYVGDQVNAVVRRIQTCGPGGIFPRIATYSARVFAEAAANNGSITVTRTITLSGDTWTSSVANGGLLVAGTHYTVANVPAGLTMVLTKTSATQVQISFTSTATAHANANDVNNIQITFLNAAVQSGNVGAIGGLNGQNLSIDFADPVIPRTATYSGTTFLEAIADNGSIVTTQTITLSGATWINSVANGSPLLAGTHYTAANIPGGLTMVLTKTSATQIQISFTGNATAHANINDVNNVQITFLNAAIQGGNAGTVAGLNGQNLSIDFTDVTVIPPTLTCTALTSTGGNVVVLNGTNFTGVTAVRFGGVNASTFAVVSLTQITATVAFGSTSGTYTVTTPSGTATCPSFTYIPTPPIITSFNPAYAISPQTVTISGTNFLGTTQVTFGGVPATIVSVTDSKIVVTLGVGTVASTPIVVAVTKPDGTATMGGFVYSNVPPIPNIGSFSPVCASTGTVVTISGTGFAGAKSVRFGGTPASFTIVNDTQILATVKAGATGSITVTSLSGTHSLPGFTFNALPTITNFAPNNLDAGQTLTITGTNFTAGCGVTVKDLYLGGRLVPSGNITVVSATQINVVMPSTASSGTVQVIRTDNANATRTGFLFNAPRPISFTPTSGTTGTAVIITGQNFSGTSGAAGVRINGVNAASYTVDSDSQITAFPAATSALTGTVVVTNSNGNGALGTFTFTPPPFVDGFYASRGAVGDTVTIFGRNFTGATAVKFGATDTLNGQIGTILSVSATQIRAVIAAGTLTGARQIRVQTPAGSGAAGTGGTRTFLIGAPLAAATITSIAPQPVSQQDSVLTITGTNLLTASGVLLNGVPVAFSATPTLTQVRVRIPVGSTSGPLVVYTQGGTVTTPVTVLPLPTITSFTPTTGPTGTLVTISGTGFTGTIGAASVRFGATNAASYTVVNDNTITATVAAGATGLIRVVAPGGTVFSATNFTYVAPVPAPTMTNVSTDIGPTGTVVTITGTNLLGANVTFGGVPATPVAVPPPSATSISVAVGTGNSGNIVVTTPGGSVNSNTALGITFTYLPHPIPTITSFSPASGLVGSTVTIIGTNLTGTSRITIGGALVAPGTFTVNGLGTIITATVPAGATTGKIVIFKDVTMPINTLIAQSATDYTVIPLLFLAKSSQSGAETQSFSAQNAVTGVRTESHDGDVVVFPNPAQSSITVRTTLAQATTVRMTLVNALGMVLWSQDISAQAGTLERSLELENLPSGMYMVELRAGAERRVKQFIKR